MLGIRRGEAVIQGDPNLCKQPAENPDQSARLDPHNGLLLVVNLDKLFDQGIISFDDRGMLLLHDSLTKQGEVVRALGLDQPLMLSNEHQLHLSAERRAFLAEHRLTYAFQDRARRRLANF